MKPPASTRLREATTPRALRPRVSISRPPANDPALVRAGTLRGFGELVAELGGDAALLLRKARIDAASLGDEERRIPYRAMAQLLESAAVELGCQEFGMRLAAAQAAQGATKMFGALDVAMRSAATLGAAFRYCAEHAAAFTPARVCFERLPDDSRLFMLIELPFAVPSYRQATEHVLALIQHAAFAVGRGEARAREVWLAHEPVAPMSAYRSGFNATVRFERAMSGLFFEDQDFDLVLPGADPQLHEIATSIIDQRHPAVRATLSMRTRILVTHLLGDGDCTHERVAAALGLHPRTLQRRLREEGESFEAIKDGVRREVALRYLRRPNVSLARMTEILGYSETSVLSRSCHRWFAASPRQLRSAAAGRHANASCT